MYLKVFGQLNLPLERHFSLCEEKGDIERAKQPWKILPSGHKIGTPEPLFKELVCIIRASCLYNLSLWYINRGIRACDFELNMLNLKQSWWQLTLFLQKDEEVELYRDKFAGSQAQRIVRAEAEAEKLAAQLKKTNVSGLLLSLILLYFQL